MDTTHAADACPLTQRRASQDTGEAWSSPTITPPVRPNSMRTSMLY